MTIKTAVQPTPRCARCGQGNRQIDASGRCWWCSEAVNEDQDFERHTMNMRTEHPNPSDMADAIRFLLERAKP